MKVLNFLGTGLAIGFVLTTVFASINGGAIYTNELIGWCIASALYGLVSVIFESNSGKYLYLALIHYALCAAITGVMIMLFYKEYFLEVLVSFTVSYVAIHLFLCFVEKKNIQKVNEKLQKGR